MSAIDVRRSRAVELAEELRAFASMYREWVVTADKCHAAASSLEWQVKWEDRHGAQPTLATPSAGEPEQP